MKRGWDIFLDAKRQALHGKAVILNIFNFLLQINLFILVSRRERNVQQSFSFTLEFRFLFYFLLFSNKRRFLPLNYETSRSGSNFQCKLCKIGRVQNRRLSRKGHFPRSVFVLRRIAEFWQKMNR